MKNILLVFLLFSSAAWPITGQQYYQATNPNTGWLNEVVFEARFDSVTEKPVLKMCQWADLSKPVKPLRTSGLFFMLNHYQGENTVADWKVCYP